jgi:hypothetical protein
MNCSRASPVEGVGVHRPCPGSWDGFGAGAMAPVRGYVTGPPPEPLGASERLPSAWNR